MVSTAATVHPSKPLESSYLSLAVRVEGLFEYTVTPTVRTRIIGLHAETSKIPSLR